MHIAMSFCRDNGEEHIKSLFTDVEIKHMEKLDEKHVKVSVLSKS